MANHNLPRRESSVHQALQALQNMGGRAHFPRWMAMVGWVGKQQYFCRDVLGRLERAGLVCTDGEYGVVTPDGRAYLGVPEPEFTTTLSVPAGPRYRAPHAPLNARRHQPPRPIRDGSLDFRNIPTRIADERLAYKGSMATSS